MSNVYHTLFKLPVIEKDGMLVDLECMAERLVKSGRMRIDAEPQINFARFTDPSLNISMMFSYKELTIPNLLANTKNTLNNIYKHKYSGKSLESFVNKKIESLLKEIAKYHQVSEELEMRIARILMQANHPVVFMMVIIERVEIFVSFSYTIGDMLDIPTWRTQSSNSGMQSTDGRNASIFVSCGGNPFYKPEKPDLKYGDGFPALSRMMVIAGQESGHYADIKRDIYGRQIDRYSANFSGTLAKEHVRLGRLNDISNTKKLRNILDNLGLENIEKVEQYIKFYAKIKKRFFMRLLKKLQHAFMVQSFVVKCIRRNIDFVRVFADHPYMALRINEAVRDMLFNLTPEADAYKDPNPQVEEAIACIEAVARIPQQVNKWGHKATSAMMGNLYQVYYKEIIPGCIRAFETISGEKFQFRNIRYKTSIFKRVKRLFIKPFWPYKIPLY